MMRYMKRALLAIWITAAMAIAAVPASFAPAPGGQVLKPSIAAAAAKDCVQLSIKINDNDKGEVCPDPNGGGVIVAYLKLILKFLSGGVGIVVLLMMTIAGVQYITAAGQPEQVKAAKNRIQNAITALVLFLIAFAFLNFIIPGGIFG